MDKRSIHDLAVAYAQAKLIKNQNNIGYDLGHTSEEIRSFLEAYYFASLHIPEEDKDIDLSRLC